MFSRELNAINKDKHNEQKCNRIIDEGGIELFNCICNCVYNILQSNIPLETRGKKKDLEDIKKLLRKLANEKTSYSRRKRLIQRGGFLGTLIPVLVGLVGKLFHWTIMDELTTKFWNEEIRL